MTKTKEPYPIIEIDDDFKIQVDPANWTVLHRKEVKKRDGSISEAWEYLGYCHDLPSSLKLIIKKKSSLGFDTSRITDYLSWEEANIHSMINRLISQEKHLKRAIEINRVMVSKNN